MAVSFLRQSKRIFIRVLVPGVVLLPLWMWLAWRLTHKRKLVVAIIDKTAPSPGEHGHISLNWVLNQERFTRDGSSLYEHDRDYFGGFPLHDNKFRVKGLERFSEEQLQRLSNDADAAYLTDAYGMSSQDLYFLRQMKDKHKLIITEFNFTGSPTAASLLNEFGEQFGIRWTGWAGRYFRSLDTGRNKELPAWLVGHYKMQHNGRWPFTKSGIAFVHSDGRVLILEHGTDLNSEFPHLISNEEGREHYGLPGSIRYNYWFDVIGIDTASNHAIATFRIDANAKGQRELSANGIGVSFPAISLHIGRDCRSFYFAGDFCDSPVGPGTSYFKGIGHFSWLMYNTRDPQERADLFWKVYRPLVTRIFNDYYFGK